MSLYKAMTEDYDSIHIEAENFSHALVVWHAWARAEWGEDYDEKDQPASIALVDDGMVWRDGGMDTNEKNIRLAVAAEREACAEVCERQRVVRGDLVSASRMIRARGKMGEP